MKLNSWAKVKCRALDSTLPDFATSDKLKSKIGGQCEVKGVHRREVIGRSVEGVGGSVKGIGGSVGDQIRLNIDSISTVSQTRHVFFFFFCPQCIAPCRQGTDMISCPMFHETVSDQKSS